MRLECVALRIGERHFARSRRQPVGFSVLDDYARLVLVSRQVDRLCVGKVLVVDFPAYHIFKVQPGLAHGFCEWAEGRLHLLCVENVLARLCLLCHKVGDIGGLRCPFVVEGCGNVTVEGGHDAEVARFSRLRQFQTMALGHVDCVYFPACRVFHIGALHDTIVGISASQSVVCHDVEPAVLHAIVQFLCDFNHTLGQELSVFGTQNLEAGQRLVLHAAERLLDGGELHIALHRLTEYDEVGLLGSEVEAYLCHAVLLVPCGHGLHGALLGIPQLGHEAADAEGAALRAVLLQLVRDEIHLGLFRRAVDVEQTRVALSAAEVGLQASLAGCLGNREILYLAVVASLGPPQLVHHGLVFCIAFGVSFQRGLSLGPWADDAGAALDERLQQGQESQRGLLVAGQH